MADLTAALDRLEQLARAVPAEACDPETILRLVRVARAAQALMHPQQMSSGYFQKRRREAGETALRAALEELNTAARLSGPAQGLEVTQR